MALWQALTVTLVGFVLTGIVGTWITYYWQTQNWKRQQKYIREKEQSEKQMAITQELSRLLDKRRYRMLRAYHSLKRNNVKKLADEWRKYDEILFEWNDNLNGHVTELRHFFGRDKQDYFESYLIGEYYRAGRALEEAKVAIDSKRTGDAKTHLDGVEGILRQLSHNTNLFLKELWEENEIHRKYIEEKPQISYNNISKLSCWYLLKNIFVTRVKV